MLAQGSRPVQRQSMNETLTPHEAAAALARANQWEDRLVHRIEGMTWMVWGLATAGIWVTLTAMGRGPMDVLPVMLSWSLWVFAGFALTYALWRSAALSRPDVVQAAAWWTYVAKVAGIALALALLHFIIEPTTPAYPLALTGFLWIMLALLGRRWSHLGKTTATAIGGLVILGGFALPFMFNEMEDLMLAAALIGGIVPVLGGLYQTLRG
jgi:hypothetical protein